MDFFIREAWAQDAAVGGGDTTAMLVQFGPLILIFAIFYFLIIRPQQKRQKGAKSLLPIHDFLGSWRARKVYP